MHRTAIVTLGAAIALAGCSSGGTGMNNAPIPSDVRRVSANVISAEEISRQSFGNAYQAIVSLRPAWEHLNVYLDDKPYGAFDKLQEIPANTIKEIRMVSRDQARVRWDLNAQAAILVLRK
jgi:ABC-type Fe3+-hydroxamate transport system substrate-binding protein